MKIKSSSRSSNGISVYEIESNKLIYSTIIFVLIVSFSFAQETKKSKNDSLKKL